MPITSIPDLVGAVQQIPLLTPRRAAKLMDRLQHRFQHPRDLAREMLRRSWLTPYQINQIFLGRGENLVLGSYLLLERLGEGGMGQVFKARHLTLERIAALKIIRQEHLSDDETVQRFRNEILALAQLSHPNIVLAYDANCVGATHFFAMEYVEGTDLEKLVRETGLLPAARACDFMRQAALGLQHGHEHGMVHRDIKPSNLLLTANETTIKILDMGLVRLRSSEADERNDAQVTRLGSIVGTPNFIAPEQALDASAADVRSDLYSLGCTFYFLLTGEPPFSGDTLTEKLLQHQLDDPRPIASFRRDVHPAITAIVGKLMAKDPGSRYQSPAELAFALMPWCGERAPALPAQLVATETGNKHATLPEFELAASGSSGTASEASRQRADREQRLWRLMVMGGSAAIVAGLLFMALLLWLQAR